MLGFSGGIIVAWKMDVLTVDLLFTHFQFLHLKVSCQGSSDWFFTPVYASPNADSRGTLWADLQSIAGAVSRGWLVAGDFNDISHPSEKKGGIPASQRKCTLFSSRINSCHLMDMGVIGHKFTWRGPLFRGHCRIFERLDRALCNADWCLYFPDAVVKVLPRVDFSDHHPLLICPFGITLHKSIPRFRFQSAWVTHATYMGTVKERWNAADDLPSNLLSLEQVLSDWQRNTYGSTQLQKRHLLTRINGIQKK